MEAQVIESAATAEETPVADNISFEGLGDLLNQDIDPQEQKPVEGADEPPSTEAPTEPEEPADPADEPEPATDEPEQSVPDEADAGISDKAQAKIDKRISSYAARAKAAEERAREIEQSVESLNAEKVKLQEQIEKAGTETLLAGDPLADVVSKGELGERRKQFRDWRRWASRNMNGGTFTFGDGTEREYSAEETQRIHDNAEDMLEIHIPAREQYLENHTRYEQLVGEQFPEWSEPSTKAYQENMEVVRQMPELKRFPNWKQLVSVFRLGYQEYDKMLQPSGKPQSKKVEASSTPTSVPSPSSAPAPAKNVNLQAEVAEAEKAVAESNGSSDAYAQMLIAKNRLAKAEATT